MYIRHSIAAAAPGPAKTPIEQQTKQNHGLQEINHRHHEWTRSISICSGEDSANPSKSATKKPAYTETTAQCGQARINHTITLHVAGTRPITRKHRYEQGLYKAGNKRHVLSLTHTPSENNHRALGINNTLLPVTKTKEDSITTQKPRKHTMHRIAERKTEKQPQPTRTLPTNHK